MEQFQLYSEQPKERAILVGLDLAADTQRNHVEDSLEELSRLTVTAGALVGQVHCFKQPRLDPGCLVGKGKVEQIAQSVKEQDASLVIFDDDLTPAQGRNLEKRFGVRVIDRTQIILDIFALHAKSKDGRLQIELAQLEYLLPRLRRMWTHLERQKGGIGLRGPGEQQLEVDRRRIQERIARLKRSLKDVRRHRNELRRGRRRHGWALISIVGYTNAGKSSLMNSLTGSSVESYDQLFATLDPTTRQVDLPDQLSALLTDTVGFIRKLPHHLVESFKATLEEVVEADLLLHVIDAAHPQAQAQIEAVGMVLQELGVANKPTLAVYNKCDLLAAPPEPVETAQCAHGSLGVRIRENRRGPGQPENRTCRYVKGQKYSDPSSHPPFGRGVLASLRGIGSVREEDYDNGSVILSANIPKKYSSRFEQYLVDASE